MLPADTLIRSPLEELSTLVGQVSTMCQSTYGPSSDWHLTNMSICQPHSIDMSVKCRSLVAKIQKLQRLQNAAAWLITRTKKFDHITPVLINLHWLPIEHRVIFKLLLFTYKALHGLGPDYLANLLTFYKPVRTLRSSRSINLFVPRSRTSTYGDRSFACVSPRLWNKLPDFIRYSETLDSFKTRLTPF